MPSGVAALPVPSNFNPPFQFDPCSDYDTLMILCRLLVPNALNPSLECPTPAPVLAPSPAPSTVDCLAGWRTNPPCIIGLNYRFRNGCKALRLYHKYQESCVDHACLCGGVRSTYGQLLLLFELTTRRSRTRPSTSFFTVLDLPHNNTRRLFFSRQRPVLEGGFSTSRNYFGIYLL